MKIGIIAQEFPPALGGMEIYAWEVCRELVRRGHELTVFTKPHPKGEVEAEGMTVYPVLMGKSHRDWTHIKPHLGKLDFIHVFNAAYAWVALETKLPVVVSVYGNDFVSPDAVVRFDLKGRLGFGDRLDRKIGRWRTRQVLDLALHKVHHVVTISHFSAGLFLDKFPHCRKKITIAYCGVSDQFFDVVRPPRVEGARPRIVTVCRLADIRKNVDVVIKALATLKDQFDFEYHVVGDGSFRPALEALAKDSGVGDRVIFHGSVSYDQLKQELAAADLFVLTSGLNPRTVEGFGIVYLEANACGTPCLAARLGGAVDAVEEGRGGFFVEDPTVEQVAAKLKEFLEGKHSYSPEQCRESAGRLRWPNVVDKIVEQYPSPAASR